MSYDIFYLTYWTPLVYQVSDFFFENMNVLFYKFLVDFPWNAPYVNKLRLTHLLFSCYGRWKGVASILDTLYVDDPYAADLVHYAPPCTADLMWLFPSLHSLPSVTAPLPTQLIDVTATPKQLTWYDRYLPDIWPCDCYLSSLWRSSRLRTGQVMMFNPFDRLQYFYY